MVEELEKRAEKLAALLKERSGTPIGVRYKEDFGSSDVFLAFGVFSLELSYGDEIVLLNCVNEMPLRNGARNLSKIYIPKQGFVDYVVLTVLTKNQT